MGRGYQRPTGQEAGVGPTAACLWACLRDLGPGTSERDGKTMMQWLKEKKSWIDRARNGGGEVVGGKEGWW